VVGAAFALRGSSPVAAIVFAQAANGILLPIIAVFLLIVANRTDLLGDQRNGGSRTRSACWWCCSPPGSVSTTC
jgi:Mn2+/Fe2+ NRAMP family transporter